jgi:predicted DNA-binding transcriptional regulator YafY
MRASRLLSILMLLQARGGLSASALAAELEVSNRTILRDIDQLSAAGVPVWAERGRDGGFRLRPGWSTQLSGLTADEAQALQLAGLPQAATELGLGAAATSARLKVLAGLPEGLRLDAERLRGRVHIDPVDWYRAATPPRHLQTVARAVWQGCLMEMRYASWSSTRSSLVRPLGLVQKAGVWYFMAQPDGVAAEPRTYRLDQIEMLTLHESRRFKAPKGFDLATQWRCATERFEASIYTGQAQLRVSPRGLRWVGEISARVRAQAQASAQAEPVARGGETGERWLRITVPIESVEHAARMFLALGPEAEVLAPTELRLYMATLGQDVAKRYGAGPSSTDQKTRKTETTGRSSTSPRPLDEAGPARPAPLKRPRTAGAARSKPAR